MRIANPIYDVFFKYLMEDLEIARRLLSAIISEDIVELSVHPQELLTRSEKFEILILRLDFKAIIKLANGEQKKVLIEIQKGKKPGDITRFRKYLGDNYLKQDVVIEDGKEKKVSLPILTIYFLGFNLKNIASPILKVNREYIDLRTSEKIDAKEEFVEKLSHDSFVIQIKKLVNPIRSELERVLQVFNQTYIANGDKKILEIKETELSENELLRLMAERLRNAAADEEMLNQVEVLEEVEGMLEDHIREKQELAEEKIRLAEEKQELAEEVEGLTDKNAQLLKKIEELEKKLGKKED